MLAMCLLDVNIARSLFLWPSKTLHKDIVTSKNYCELLAASMD